MENHINVLNLLKEGTYVGSDRLKISALKEGKCNYYSIWGSTEGVIALEIFNADGSSNCCVRLVYYDAINYKTCTGLQARRLIKHSFL